MEDRFRGLSTKYRDGKPYWQKARILYQDSRSKRRVTVSYTRNHDIPHALENTLLHFVPVGIAEITQKVENITQLAHSQLTTLSSNLYETVTGLEFRTENNGQLFWRVFEDLDEAVDQVPIEKIPVQVPRINISELCTFNRLHGPVNTVEYRGTKYVFKAHDLASQNRIFPAELFARIKLDDVPHIATFNGVVTTSDFSPARRGSLRGRHPHELLFPRQLEATIA